MSFWGYPLAFVITIPIFLAKKHSGTYFNAMFTEGVNELVGKNMYQKGNGYNLTDVYVESSMPIINQIDGR